MDFIIRVAVLGQLLIPSPVSLLPTQVTQHTTHQISVTQTTTFISHCGLTDNDVDLSDAPQAFHNGAPHSFHVRPKHLHSAEAIIIIVTGLR